MDGRHRQHKGAEGAYKACAVVFRPITLQICRHFQVKATVSLHQTEKVVHPYTMQQQVSSPDTLLSENTLLLRKS